MFRGMHYIYEVYKEKSFSKAASNLYISQPSLSAAVKKTEDRIGALIFDRSTNPIQLTECGKEYIHAVEKIMDIETNFSNFLNDLDELKTGKVVIGGSNLFASYLLPPMISKFSVRYPHVQTSLVEATTSQLGGLLLDGSVDLILENHEFDSSIYDKVFLSEENLLLVVPKHFSSNALAEEFRLNAQDILHDHHLKPEIGRVPLPIFKNEPFILLRPENDTRIRAEKLCKKDHFEPHMILELDQQLTSYNITGNGMGISFISDTLVKNVRPNDNVVFYKLNDKIASRNLYFYHKKNRYVTRAMEEFLKIACD